MTTTITTDEGTFEVPEIMNALEVLRQAGDLLEISYWISGHEFCNYQIEDKLEILPVYTKSSKLAKWSGKKKGIKRLRRKTESMDSPEYYITQMCSIGALSMSRLTDFPGAEANGVPEIQYSYWWNADLATTLAGHALINVISKHLASYYLPSEIEAVCLDDAPLDVITSWNDDDARTREEVVAFFREAEAEVCLTYTELWRVQYDDYSSVCQWFAFGSEQEANDAMAFLMAVPTPKDNYGIANFSEMCEDDSPLTTPQWALRLAAESKWQPVRVLPE